MNEELRSASEELETGKEELQSLNEELTTLNAELKEKVEEVSLANSDLQNLMASTRIATLFIDRATCVKRYTPSLLEIFNIIPTDVGRPLAHLTHNLNSNNLTADVQKVLEDLQTVEREVSTKDGRWYILRLLPYRTTDDKIYRLHNRSSSAVQNRNSFVNPSQRRQLRTAIIEGGCFRLRLEAESIRRTSGRHPECSRRPELSGSCGDRKSRWRVCGERSGQRDPPRKPPERARD